MVSYFGILFSDAPCIPITAGKFEVRSGSNSSAPVLSTGRTLSDLTQPEGGFLNQDGFYIRAFLPADKRQNKLSFVYGAVEYVEPG